MSWIVSIDPGVQHHGIAYWYNGVLRHAWLQPSHTSLPKSPLVAVSELVIEIPQTYGGRSAKGDTNDLIDLAFAAGFIARRINAASVVKMRPREWKGQVPKKIMIERVRSKLKPEETLPAVIALPAQQGLRHNVWDGIGIGLKRLGRL